MKIKKNKTYIGPVVDNMDPLKQNRVRIQVLDIYDDFEIEGIPWATPWKDLNGNECNVPEIGKVMVVIFDQGDIYKPEYIYAEHYNKNLENKLNKLSDSDYTSMKSLLFDHKTQVYVNESEGLILDHKFNKISIKENSIDIDLKDNNRNLNLGDSTANQQAILGNHWLDWFDKFVEQLLGNGGGPYLGNLSAPVVANPSFIKVLLEYKQLRDPVFLSHHVNVVDNNKISTVRMSERENIAQYGDDWASTKSNNELSKQLNEDFSPIDGPKKEYEPEYVAPSTDGSETQRVNDNPLIDLSDPKNNPRVDKLLRFLNYKGYVSYDKVNVLNLVALRSKDEEVSNKFDDILCVFFKNSNNNWELIEYNITTTPGYKPKTNELPSSVVILKLGQYIDQYKMGYHQNRNDHPCLKYANSIVHRNDNPFKYNTKAKTSQGNFGINIHRSSKMGSSENVYNWSEGCQVFKNINQYNQFINLCKKQETEANKDTFTYTLCRKNEFDSFE